MIVAIDGPAGSGKGTITEIVSKELNLVNISSGGAYRCVALLAIQNNLEVAQKEEILNVLNNSKIEFKNENGKDLVYLNGEDVTDRIREKDVAKIVSQISSIKEVRFKLNEIFRQCAKDKNVIMEGRDIGTYVFPNANVKICATHSGVTVGEDGATHQMIEDLAMMRTMPNMTVISTSDDTETKWAVKEISKYNGPVYLRLARVKTRKIYNENQKFEIGKAIQIGEGTDATVFATGVTVEQALIAKEKLEKQGVNIRVVDIHTIKPIDEEMIVKCAKETKKLISVEDHNVIGGLGSAISEVLTEEYPVKLVRMGINDTFGKSGKAIELMQYFGITAENIVEKVVK